MFKLVPERSSLASVNSAALLHDRQHFKLPCTHLLGCVVTFAAAVVCRRLLLLPLPTVELVFSTTALGLVSNSSQL
jgi:hypothetical protein